MIDISDPIVFSWLSGALLLVALVLGYPSVMTAVALARSERVLGKLFWNVVMAWDSRRLR